MLRWMLSFCVIAILLALNTSPTQKEFKSYVYTRLDTAHGKPFIRFNSYKLGYFDLFSINYASECKEIIPLPNAIPGTSETTQEVEYKKEQKYLGLFGTFWKL